MHQSKHHFVGKYHKDRFQLHIHYLNQQTYLANKDRLLADIQADFAASYKESLQTVISLSETDLFDPQCFAWREGDSLWHMVEANTWAHYREHRESISRWLGSQP